MKSSKIYTLFIFSIFVLSGCSSVNLSNPFGKQKVENVEVYTDQYVKRYNELAKVNNKVFKNNRFNIAFTEGAFSNCFKKFDSSIFIAWIKGRATRFEDSTIKYNEGLNSQDFSIEPILFCETTKSISIGKDFTIEGGKGRGSSSNYTGIENIIEDIRMTLTLNIYNRNENIMYGTQSTKITIKSKTDSFGFNVYIAGTGFGINDNKIIYESKQDAIYALLDVAFVQLYSTINFIDYNRILGTNNEEYKTLLKNHFIDTLSSRSQQDILKKLNDIFDATNFKKKGTYNRYSTIDLKNGYHNLSLLGDKADLSTAFSLYNLIPVKFDEKGIKKLNDIKNQMTDYYGNNETFHDFKDEREIISYFFRFMNDKKSNYKKVNDCKYQLEYIWLPQTFKTSWNNLKTFKLRGKPNYDIKSLKILIPPFKKSIYTVNVEIKREGRTLKRKFKLYRDNQGNIKFISYGGVQS